MAKKQKSKNAPRKDKKKNVGKLVLSVSMIAAGAILLLVSIAQISLIYKVLVSAGWGLVVFGIANMGQQTKWNELSPKGKKSKVIYCILLVAMLVIGAVLLTLLK